MQDYSIASVPSNAYMETTSVTDLIRAMPNDSSSSSSSLENCDFIEMEAKDDPQPFIAVTQQMATKRVPQQIMALGFPRTLLREPEEV